MFPLVTKWYLHQFYIKWYRLTIKCLKNMAYIAKIKLIMQKRMLVVNFKTYTTICVREVNFGHKFRDIMTISYILPLCNVLQMFDVLLANSARSGGDWLPVLCPVHHTTLGPRDEGSFFWLPREREWTYSPGGNGCSWDCFVWFLRKWRSHLVIHFISCFAGFPVSYLQFLNAIMDYWCLLVVVSNSHVETTSEMTYTVSGGGGR